MPYQINETSNWTKKKEKQEMFETDYFPNFQFMKIINSVHASNLKKHVNSQTISKKEFKTKTLPAR